ncbi:MAG: glucose-1-phosphate thymidylyltransferase [Candidatus Bathyarchaeia archaeon]
MKGLLLAGGYGTRLRPLTYTGNKHMIPIANKPMLFYGLGHLKDAGISEIGIVLGPVKEGILEAVGDGSKFGVKVTYIEQPEPKGLAHAALISKDFLGDEPFVMYLGDNLLKNGISYLVNEFKGSRCDALIAVAQVNAPERFGVVEIVDGKPVRLVEKPREPRSNFALVGVYFFTSKIFDAIKRIKVSWRNELEITDAIQQLIDLGGDVHAHVVRGWWKDTGRPEDILEANQLVLFDLEGFNYGVVEKNASLTGNVGIGAGTKILSGTHIRGPAIIGEGCEIGPNAYIGPYTSIGNNVTIRDAEVENSIIMDDVFIACKGRIVDSLIGKHSEITHDAECLPKGFRFIVGDRAILKV